MFLSFKSLCYEMSVSREQFARAGVPSSHPLVLVLGRVLGMDQEYPEEGKWDTKRGRLCSPTLSEGELQLGCVPGIPIAGPPSWGELLAL